MRTVGACVQMHEIDQPRGMRTCCDHVPHQRALTGRTAERPHQPEHCHDAEHRSGDQIGHDGPMTGNQGNHGKGKRNQRNPTTEKRQIQLPHLPGGFKPIGLRHTRVSFRLSGPSGSASLRYQPKPLRSHRDRIGATDPRRPETRNSCTTSIRP